MVVAQFRKVLLVLAAELFSHAVHCRSEFLPLSQTSSHRKTEPNRTEHNTRERLETIQKMQLREGRFDRLREDRAILLY